MSNRTRRQVLLGTAGTAVAVHVAAARADSSPKSDPDVLRGLLAVERLQIVVYRRVIATGLLSIRVRRVAEKVIAQELAHVGAVGRELAQRGGDPAAVPAITATDQVNEALSHIKVSDTADQLHTEHDCVHLLLDLEMGAQREYYKAIGEFHDLGLAHLGAQILASEGQHQTTVSEARRPGNAWQAVPNAFVGGNP